MKSLIIVLTFFYGSLSYSQRLSSDSALAKANIHKSIITAFEYSNGKQVNTAKHYETFNDFGRTINFKTVDAHGKVTYNNDYAFIDRSTQEEMQYGKNGKLDFKFIRVFDDKGDMVRSLQLTPNNDTLVFQQWLKDRHGLDSAVITNNKLQSITKHDDLGKVIEDISFDDKGYVVERNLYKEVTKCNCTDFYLSANGKKFVYNGKVCSTSNEEVEYIKEDSEGYLYGIKLVSKKNGRRIEIKDTRGLTTSVKYVDSKSRLLALIVFAYE